MLLMHALPLTILSQLRRTILVEPTILWFTTVGRSQNEYTRLWKVKNLSVYLKSNFPLTAWCTFPALVGRGLEDWHCRAYAVVWNCFITGARWFQSLQLDEIPVAAASEGPVLSGADTLFNIPSVCLREKWIGFFFYHPMAQSNHSLPAGVVNTHS